MRRTAGMRWIVAQLNLVSGDPINLCNDNGIPRYEKHHRTNQVLKWFQGNGEETVLAAIRLTVASRSGTAAPLQSCHFLLITPHATRLPAFPLG